MSSRAVPEAGDFRIETTENSSVVRTLSVVVDAARVKKAFDRAYRDLARSAQVKGFRKGKVPRSVLVRLFGASVAEEIERTLVSETLADAVELAELSPVSEPEIEADIPSADSDFRYSARIEIKPEIELPDPTRLSGKRPVVEVGDEEVEAELDSLRQRNAPLVEEPDSAVAAEGHVLNIDFTGRIDGVEFEGGSGKNVAIELGSGQMVSGFEDQLLGARAGENRELLVTFPEDYQAEKLRGKQAVFSVQVLNLRRRQVPDLDDEFAKDLGDFETLDQLRERMRSDLDSGRRRQAESVLRRTLMDSLIAETDFEVPAGMVERQLQRQLRAMQQQFQGQVPEAMLNAQLSRIHEEGRPAAERRVREMLLLEAVARSRDISASDEEVDARLDELAETQGVESSRFRQLAREQDWIDAIRAELVDQKALDFLVAEAKVEETTDT
jgi:trigger factor